MTQTVDNPRRHLPSVDAVLKIMPQAIERWGHGAVVAQVRQHLDAQRAQLHVSDGAAGDINDLAEAVHSALEDAHRSTLKPVLNLTGTVLHTNLGRAVLPEQALEAIVTVAGSNTNLEFDLDSGQRGDRESHIEGLVCELTGAEAATAVNNNAAAVLLVLNTLAQGKQVPVSRGELVEIGGSFRIPEVMQRSGCELVEIGATNRTHLKDYRESIGENTALLMKVHTSNYEVSGFTAAVEEPALAALAHEHQLPFVVDLGSGNLVDFTTLGLPHEPTAASAMENGADIITFSGDKLLGGPQAGIIAGRADLIALIKRNPLKRALRLDKMTLAALAEVLKLYRNPDTLKETLPALRMLTRAEAEIRSQADALLPRAKEALAADFEVDVASCHSQIGSGSLPVDTLPSAALRISSADNPSALLALAAKLRDAEVPVIGRLHQDALWLDLRCLSASEENTLVDQLQSAT